MTLLLLIVGFSLLVVGAEALVRGASKLAGALGISPLVIGLTIVAYGTSAPEMAVSINSSMAGQADIALGNVIGSNIFNVLFILGVSAIIVPLVVSQQLVRIDVPVMIGVSILMLVLGADGKINRLDGIILIAGALLYTGFLIYQSRKEGKAVQEEYAQQFGNNQPTKLKQWVVNLGLIAGGLGLLVLGSRWLVASAVSIAQYLGIGELIIGLTIIAVGTSLPEVATSVIASIRGARDIAVGNVVGSNIFNILAVLGLAGIAAPDSMNVSNTVLRFDVPIMIAVAIACLPIFFTGNVIARWEGVLFLGYYGAYTAYLILAATEHNALPVLSATMIVFVMPITVLTLVVVTIRAIWSVNKSAKQYR